MQNQESLIPFRRFDNWQNAQHCVEMLEKIGIEYKLEEYDKNPVVLGSLLAEKEFLIKVRQEDFEQADEKLLQATEINVPDLDPNYYLFGFSDEELIEILVKPSEWGEIDRAIAPKLLIGRGYDINNLKIDSKKEKHIKELAKPQEESPEKIMKGYVCVTLGGLCTLFYIFDIYESLFDVDFPLFLKIFTFKYLTIKFEVLSAICYLLGLTIAWGLINTKTTLPNGEQVYTYTEKCQKHGARIFILALVMSFVSVLTLICRIFFEF